MYYLLTKEEEESKALPPGLSPRRRLSRRPAAGRFLRRRAGVCASHPTPSPAPLPRPLLRSEINSTGLEGPVAWGELAKLASLEVLNAFNNSLNGNLGGPLPPALTFLCEWTGCKASQRHVPMAPPVHSQPTLIPLNVLLVKGNMLLCL